MRELKKMFPALLIYNGLLLAGITAVGFIAGFDWRLYTGVLAGNALMTGNFLLIGATANRILASRNSNRGRFFGNLSYGLRYIGIFAVLAILLTFELISPFTAVIPLFYPKIYYTLDALRHSSEE